MVWSFASGYRLQIAAAALALLVAAAATSGVPYAFKLIIDKGFATGAGSTRDIARWFEYLLMLVAIKKGMPGIGAGASSVIKPENLRGSMDDLIGMDDPAEWWWPTHYQHYCHLPNNKWRLYWYQPGVKAPANRPAIRLRYQGLNSCCARESYTASYLENA